MHEPTSCLGPRAACSTSIAVLHRLRNAMQSLAEQLAAFSDAPQCQVLPRHVLQALHPCEKAWVQGWTASTSVAVCFPCTSSDFVHDCGTLRRILLRAARCSMRDAAVEAAVEVLAVALWMADRNDFLKVTALWDEEEQEGAFASLPRYCAAHTAG